jgi:DNA polymerase III epsilon subunit-like protein
MSEADLRNALRQCASARATMLEANSGRIEMMPALQYGRSYLVFDFETTGLDFGKDRIIQVGLCLVSDGMVAERHDWLVRQNVPIDPEATKVHGITAEAVQACGVSPHESLARLFEAMRNAPACVGHNIHRFDIRFMGAESRRLGVTPPDPRNFIDTAALFKGWRLGLRKGPHESHQDYANRVFSIHVTGLRYSVEACVQALDIRTDLAGRHSASHDAYLTHLILLALQARL